MALEFSAPSKTFNFKNFNCGEPSLNEYLRFYALRNDRSSISRLFIAHDPDRNPREVVGYYTVSSAQVAFENYPEGAGGKIPRYLIPAMRIGRLACSAAHQGRGLGAALLKDALMRAVTANQVMAIHCVLVDALNEKAAGFYSRYGFVPVRENPLTMVLPMATILDAIG